MSKVYEMVERCYESIKDRLPFQPQVALILGSGMGDYGDHIEVVSTLDYHDIEGFPVSTVSGHKGRFLFGYVGKVPVVCMQGRVHYYEGYPIQQVVLPTRLMRRMGAEVLFLTNAAGSVNFDYEAGDFMMITDQISNMVPSPLIGENADELGVRLPDMSEIYDKDLRELIRATAKEIGVNLREGVYMQLTGPNFETPAEVRMCRILGADACGMSTACEAIAANHMGMKICGISCISNLGCGMSDEPLSDEDVKITANRVAPLFRALVTGTIEKIGALLAEQKAE